MAHTTEPSQQSSAREVVDTLRMTDATKRCVRLIAAYENRSMRNVVQDAIWRYKDAMHPTLEVGRNGGR